MRSLSTFALSLALVGCEFAGAPVGPNSVADAGSGDGPPPYDAPVPACLSNGSYAALDGEGPRYRFVAGEHTYLEANAACAGDDARLVTLVGDAQMSRLLVEVGELVLSTPDCRINGAPTPCALVGLRQLANAADEEASWSWSSGDLFDGKDPLWRAMQPDDDGGGENDAENCAIITSEGNDGVDDRPCDRRYPVICECAPN